MLKKTLLTTLITMVVAGAGAYAYNEHNKPVHEITPVTEHAQEVTQEKPVQDTPAQVPSTWIKETEVRYMDKESYLRQINMLGKEGYKINSDEATYLIDQLQTSPYLKDIPQAERGRIKMLLMDIQSGKHKW